MGRTKSVPVAKRQAANDPLIDDTEPQEETSFATYVYPRYTKRRRKSLKTKIYEFAVEPDFEDFLNEANFYLTIKYVNKS